MGRGYTAKPCARRITRAIIVCTQPTITTARTTVTAYTRRPERRGRPHGTRQRRKKGGGGSRPCVTLSLYVSRLSHRPRTRGPQRPELRTLTTSNCENYRLSTTKTTTFFLYGVRLRMELALPGRRLLRPENVVVRDLEKLLEFRHLLLVRSWPLKLQDDVLSAPPRFVAADGPHDLVELHELCW